MINLGRSTDEHLEIIVCPGNGAEYTMHFRWSVVYELTKRLMDALNTRFGKEPDNDRVQNP
jgi:hypothetical protein